MNCTHCGAVLDGWVPYCTDCGCRTELVSETVSEDTCSAETADTVFVSTEAAKPKKMLWVIAAAAVLLIVIISGFLIGSPSRQHNARFVLAGGNFYTLGLNGSGRQLAVIPNNAHITAVTDGDAAVISYHNFSGHTLLALSQNESFEIAGAHDNYKLIGDVLYYISWYGTLYKYNISTKTIEVIAGGVVSFAAEGDAVVYYTRSDMLYLQIRNGSPRYLFPKSGVVPMAVCPGGKRILYLADTSLYVWSAADGSRLVAENPRHFYTNRDLTQIAYAQHFIIHLWSERHETKVLTVLDRHFQSFVFIPPNGFTGFSTSQPNSVSLDTDDLERCLLLIDGYRLLAVNGGKAVVISEYILAWHTQLLYYDGRHVFFLGMPSFSFELRIQPFSAFTALYSYDMKRPDDSVKLICREVQQFQIYNGDLYYRDSNGNLYTEDNNTLKRLAHGVSDFQIDNRTGQIYILDGTQFVTPHLSHQETTTGSLSRLNRNGGTEILADDVMQFQIIENGILYISRDGTLSLRARSGRTDTLAQNISHLFTA
jgi:hypothetical protein